MSELGLVHCLISASRVQWLNPEERHLVLESHWASLHFLEAGSPFADITGA